MANKEALNRTIQILEKENRAIKAERNITVRKASRAIAEQGRLVKKLELLIGLAVGTLADYSALHDKGEAARKTLEHIKKEMEG